MLGNDPQISEIEQGLKSSVVTLLVGFIKYVWPALQMVSLNGQQLQPAGLQEHVCAVQSCIAPMQNS